MRELVVRAERLAGTAARAGRAQGRPGGAGHAELPAAVIAHFAILRANAVVVPVNPMNRAEELKHYITDPDAKVAITTGDLAADIAKADARAAARSGWRTCWSRSSPTPSTRAAGDEAMPRRRWRDWLLARHPLPRWRRPAHAWTGRAGQRPALARTCGSRRRTTWRCCPTPAAPPACPRAACITHRSIMHNAMAGQRLGQRAAGDVSAAVVPMFHITGMVSMRAHQRSMPAPPMVHHAALGPRPGGPADLAAGRSPLDQHPDDGDRPAGQPQLRRFDLSSLVLHRRRRRGHAAGRGAAPARAVRADATIEGYGLTETAAPSHTNPYDESQAAVPGHPLHERRLARGRPETLQEVPVASRARSSPAAPMVFDGYWKRPRPPPPRSSSFDGKRFFRTGDLGRVDEDGYFFITDRLKRMINASAASRSGRRRSRLLMFRHPAIQEACIIGTGRLPRRDGQGGGGAAARPTRAGASRTSSTGAARTWRSTRCRAIVQFVDACPRAAAAR
jgi:fatty-acyl-CoA synthase